ncbi:hypothetical protein [Halodesulfovibrio aestuarii]|uniref:Uncharacterized protein n=1 Tax=Halodesulfovibrio aestuarii TaxID=126333 RepID=A0A8G2C7P6_9BACT|nr:hypothetical protein [Halodesulfovibrio aestuarii]SHI68219.1 hypothetical protein SAMN05660830_00655 [Halodesulfovibrio aestuarii]
MKELKELKSRLRNCLHTILELEPDLDDIELSHDLRDEFGMLKMLIERINEMELVEADVARIESATANFLEELQLPMSHVKFTAEKRRFLQ